MTLLLSIVAECCHSFALVLKSYALQACKYDLVLYFFEMVFPLDKALLLVAQAQMTLKLDDF